MPKILLHTVMLFLFVGCSARKQVLVETPFETSAQHLSGYSMNAPAEKAIDRTPFHNKTTLTESELVSEVLKRNSSLSSMRKTYQAALERESQVSALDDPMLSYISVPTSINSSEVDYGQKITLSQKFPWPGKLALKGKRADALARASKEELSDLTNRIIEATKRAFFEYYYVTKALQVNTDNIKIIKEFASVAEGKYSAGTASKQDALQAEVRLLHLQHQRIGLKRALHVTTSKINTLLQIPSDIPLPSAPETLPFPTHIDAVQRLVQLAKENNPTLTAIDEKIRAKEASVKLAEKEFMPDFTIEAGYNSIWQEDDLRPIVGIGINLPLQLEKRRAKKREEENLLQSLKAERAAKSAEIEHDVKTAIDNINESFHIVSLYRSKLLPAADENLKAARSEYEAGKGDYLRFLTAEESYLTARLELERALATYHQHRAHLANAIGEQSLDLNYDLHNAGGAQ